MRLQRLDLTNCAELSETALVETVRELVDLSSCGVGRRRLQPAA